MSNDYFDEDKIQKIRKSIEDNNLSWDDSWMFLPFILFGKDIAIPNDDNLKGND